MQERLDVDAAYCISLKEATGRREQLTEEWEKIGIDVDYYLVDRAPNPALACSQTHQDICRILIDNNWERVLVFEDDCRFYDIPAGMIARINKFLNENQTWDVFYLGGILGKLWLTKYKSIARIRCAGVHSYIVHRRACEKIVTWDYTTHTKAVDTVYKKELKGYSCFPLLTWQEEVVSSPSNIAQQRMVEGALSPFNTKEVWEKTKKKQYRCAYFRYLHRWLFRLQQ